MSLNRAKILAQLDDERRTIPPAGHVLESAGGITRFRAMGHAHHQITASSLGDDTADAVIDREIAHFRLLNAEFEWKVYAHDSPADLLERLRSRGLEIGEQEAVMVFDLANSAPWIDAPTPHVVRRIEEARQIDDFRRAAEEIFGKQYNFTSDRLAAALKARCTDHQGYVGYCDGEPASVGRLFTHPQSHFGGLYGGGTRPAFRGRGFYRALVAARARDSLRLGAKYLLVDALPTSRPILERLGFEELTQTWPCTWKPAAQS